jgi:hypothetical protein
MNGKTAIGHMCGKIAKILYMILKTGQKYDPIKYAQAIGIPWLSYPIMSPEKSKYCYL